MLSGDEVEGESSCKASDKASLQSIEFRDDLVGPLQQIVRVIVLDAELVVLPEFSLQIGDGLCRCIGKRLEMCDGVPMNGKLGVGGRGGAEGGGGSPEGGASCQTEESRGKEGREPEVTLRTGGA